MRFRIGCLILAAFFSMGINFKRGPSPPACGFIYADGRNGGWTNTSISPASWTPLTYPLASVSLRESRSTNLLWATGAASTAEICYSGTLTMEMYCTFNIRGFSIGVQPMQFAWGLGKGTSIADGDETLTQGYIKSFATAPEPATVGEFLTIETNDCIGPLASVLSGGETWSTYDWEMMCRQESTDVSPCS